MMLPPVPESPEDEKSRKPSLQDHADLPKGDTDSFEADLQESDTDHFEHGDDPMPPSFQDPTFEVDSVQNISELDESQDDWDDLETNEESYDDLETNEEVRWDIPATQFILKASLYEHPRPLSQPLIVSQEETYGEHSETTSEILHSSLHQHPLPLPPLPNIPPVTQQPVATLSENTPLLTLSVSEDNKNISDLLPELHVPARQHPHSLSQPLVVSQEEKYGEHSETISEILHSSLHEHPLPLPSLPNIPPVTQQPVATLSDYTPLLTLPASEDYENSSDLLPELLARQHAQKQVPPLKLIPPVQGSTTSPPPSPPPRTTSLPQQSYQPITEDSDSTADDPYLAFSMDLESLDISKLTLEQLEQIDPRQAQIWMLLKMHQMIRKVEDVYESAEQLYSIRQAPPPIPKKPNMQENREDKQFRRQNYENTLQCVKRPIPTPRQNIARNQSKQGDPRESESVDTPKKMYRQQKIIGKLLNTTMSVPLA